MVRDDDDIRKVLTKKENENMTSIEKYERMLELAVPEKRSDIPVFPHIITWCGTCAGISQAEMMRDGERWLEAMDKTFAVIGKPDVSMSTFPDDTVFGMGLPACRPGYELGDNELYQFIEKPFFSDASEYQKMLQMGWGAWYGMYMMQIQKPPMQSFDELGARFARLGQNCGRVMGFLAERGIAPLSHTATAPIYDTLSMVRSMEEFIMDLYTEPGPVMDVINRFQPEEDAKTIGMLKSFGGTRVSVYAMRSCAPFVSPAMFEEYVWPALKRSIETYFAAGIRVILHADAQWMPVLPYFTKLPKTSVHFEFDGVTNMFDAYEVVGGGHSMRGDVPSTMFSRGTPDEVSEYCEKLINGLCMKGGVMLGSGCEVPLNAKTECVIAMMESVKK
jgi:uroporphyrinogen decarboxylase